MPILGPPSSPLPQQRPRGLPPFAPPPAGSTAVSAGTSTASATAPFGAGASAGTSTATAVGAALTTGAASSAGTSTAIATSNATFPLTIDSSGRYFKTANGTPILITAQTTWSLAVDIPLSGLSSFLSTITGQGFNACMFNAIEHHYSVAKPPKERGGNLPFTQRLDGASYTGSPNGTTGAAGTQGQFASDNYSNINTQAPDPTFINNTYWTTVESILDACLAANVLVFVWPAYLGFHAGDEGWLQEMVAWNAVTGAGGFIGQSFADNTKSRMWNYGAWLAARWKAYPNIIWVVGGDYGSNTQTLDTQQLAAVNQFVLGMKSVSGQASTLWTAHWDRPALSTDTTLTSVTFDLNFAYAGEETAELTRRGYAVSPTKPCILGEYNYEDGLFGGSAPWRKYLYWGFLGGIAGGFFGHEQLWRFDDGTPGTDYATLLATQGTLDASRQFAFWRARPWHRLKPSGLGGMGTIVTAGGGTASPQGTDYVAAAATSEGDLLLAYVPPAHTGSVTIDMTKMSAMSVARWFDPANATFTSAGAFLATGTHAFTTPGNNSAGDADWLLLLEVPIESAAGTSTASAVGASLAAGNAAAAGISTATAVGAAIVAADAAATGSATVSAAGAAAAVGSGSSAGTSTASAVGIAAIAGAGTATGTATAAAVGTALAVGAASSVGVGSASATGAALTTGSASSSGAGTAAAVGAAVTIGAASSAGTGSAAAAGAALATGIATAAGIGSAAATGSAVAVGSAAAVGVGAASAVGSALASGAASSAGSGAASATGAGVTPGGGSGTAAGTSTAAAVGASIAAGVGSAAGSSTATVAGAALAAGAAVSAGMSTVTAAGGVAGTTGAGVSAGASTASAVGAWQIAAAADAAGTSTASAVGASWVFADAMSAGTSTASASSAPTDPVTALEDAIHAWVRYGSQLDDDHVIWSGDGPSGPQPEGTYISMRIIDDDTASDDWMLPRRSGAGIAYRVRSHHMVTVELSCNAGDSFGSQRSLMILRRVIAAIAFPSVIEIMKTGRIGIGPVSKIRMIPGVRSGLLDPKAMCTVGVHMLLDIEEPGNEIRTAQVTTETEVGTQSGTVVKP